MFSILPAPLEPQGPVLLPTDRPWLIKVGFDPTSPDLHLGHAVLLRALRTLQDQGHQVVVVVGDFTARIGDPSGRNATRPMLTQAQVQDNARTYLEQAMRLLDPARTRVRHNSQWLSALSASDLLAMLQHATLSQMLARHDFAQRHAAGAAIGLHELVYPLLQGQDSVILRCDLEVGGSDQLFNLMRGRDQQQAAGLKPQAVATVPLLVGLDGQRKMSKSYGNHIGLLEDPIQAFGKTMRIPDALVSQWSQLLDVPVSATDPYQAKRELARGIVSMLHGPGEATAADADWQHRFVARAAPIHAPHRPATPGASLIQVLVEWGFAASLNQARQKVREGAVRIDGQKVFEPNLVPVCGLIQLGRRQAARLAQG